MSNRKLRVLSSEIIRDKLEGILGTGKVFTDDEVLKKYSRDQSFVSPL